MTFPTTEYPLSISHSDGSGLKTDKSKLLNKLEELQDGFSETPLPVIDATLIDGGLLIHSFLCTIGKITSYGNLARTLLAYVCGSRGNEVHELFDTYRANSLKKSERNLRGADDHAFVIAGPQQAPKQSCQKLLQNGKFKDQLALFLLQEWQKDHYGPILANKSLIVSHGGNCVCLTFNEQDSRMNVERPINLQGSHEEADTLLVFHASSVTGNVVIRASDTDVLVILLGMIGKHQNDDKTVSYGRIIMDCGKGNNRRDIDITHIASALESKQIGLAAAMPGLHAFTGSDCTTAFYRKGKIKSLAVLERDEEGKFIKFFRGLTSERQPEQSRAEEFICSLYGMKGDIKEVNEARLEKICQMTGKMDKENPMSNVKKVDCALLPPCSKTVNKKLQRAHLISMVWGNADSAHPGENLDPRNFGWKEKDGCYAPEWFSGPSMPDDLFQGEDEEQEDCVEDCESDDSDFADVFDRDNGINSNSDSAWSDDSESAIEL